MNDPLPPALADYLARDAADYRRRHAEEIARSRAAAAEERRIHTAVRASRGTWLLRGEDVDDAAPALRALVAAEADVSPVVWTPYELLDNLGCAAVVDLQLRSAFERWMAALRLGWLARLPGSFGTGDA